MSVAENLRRIQERIRQACERAGRDPQEVKLLGASKGQPPEKIREAAQAGLRLVGENYVQEAERKKAQLADLPLTWHLIGYLQKNKARKAFHLFDLIQTVDRTEIAEKLARLAKKEGRFLPIFIEVNIGEEASKHGVPPGELFNLVRRIRELPSLELRGLMCIPPYEEDPEAVRPYFRRLRELRDRLREELDLPALTELSMGMSHDFEVAIEEGATLVRIGTALFGPRPRRR